MRVKAGKFYVYEPCLLDITDARTSLKRGDVVRVVNLHGCPPANTMGHAHVEQGGQFVGLVSTASLQPLQPRKPRERGPSRNERILEHGWQGYAAEEGHYD